MRYISDLHIHSRFSRACSKELNIRNLEKYARIKGINLLGTSDFTHPEWIKELKSELAEDGSGILQTRSGFPFLLTSEIALIYSQDGKGRKVHVVLLAWNFETVEKITQELLKRGRVDYDGRPIFGIPCPDFVKLMKGIDDNIEIIPAHIWTPWFSMFGSNSGFDRVEDCFKDTTKYIHALETGLSSDPAMNWRLSQLDRFSLVSFSDSHSFWPWRLGREATVFDLNELNYESIIRALHTKEGLSMTIEVDPGYGKYHYDGHRKCGVSLAPRKSIELGKICPECGRQLTIGVDHRIEELADRKPGYKPEGAVPYLKLIPISDIISGVNSTGVATQKTWKIYNDLIAKFGNEMKVALDVPKDELISIVSPEICDAIIKNREQKIEVIPGYDGVYGVPVLGNPIPKKKEIIKQDKQLGLSRFA